MKTNQMLNSILIILGAGLLVTALYMIFFYVPTEQTMGVVQRIFYFHVPVAWIALLSYVIVLIGSVMYLWKRAFKWDAVASSAAEIGFIFTTMFLITGSIWAKPAWGVWWTWSPRLTSALVLWFIYIAYLAVRAFAQEREQGYRFASIVGIVGAIDIPIVILSITMWRTQHPGAIIFEGGLTPSMLLTLQISIFAFTILFIMLLIQAITIKKDSNKIKELSKKIRSNQN